MRLKKVIHGQLLWYQANVRMKSKSLPWRWNSHNKSIEKAMCQIWELEGRVKISRGRSSNHTFQNGYSQISKTKMQKKSGDNTYKGMQQQSFNYRGSLRSRRKISRGSRNWRNWTPAIRSFIYSKGWDTISMETGGKTTNSVSWTKRRSFS